MGTTTKKTWLKILAMYVVIGFLAVLPFLSVLLSIAIADYFGCQLDEGSQHACMAGGSDISGALYPMFVLGWLGLVTLPFGLGAAALFTVIWIVVLMLRSGKTSSTHS